MWRRRLALVLGLILVASSAMAAEMLKAGPGAVKRPRMAPYISKGPTTSGYYFGGQLKPSALYYYLGGPPKPGSIQLSNYPISGVLTVRVKDREGKDAPGIPVALELSSRSQLDGKLWVDAATGKTDASGKFVVKVWLDEKIGQSAAGEIIVRVEDLTDDVGIAVTQSPERAN